MMEEQQYEMSEYQHVNPYEMIYRNMNFQIDQTLTKDTAENIARQLGFMHNAFGIVAKDLIKIVGMRFQTDKPSIREENGKNKDGKRDREGVKNKKRAHPEENEPREREEVGRMRKKIVVSLDSSGEGEMLKSVREGSVGFAQKGTDQLPPNSDIFNQFAYKQSGHQESNNTVPTTSRFDASFKQKLSKIVEEVASKRKKTVPLPIDPIAEQAEITSPHIPVTDEERKQEPSPNGQVTSQHELKEQQGEAAFLNEFEYRSNHSSDKGKHQTGKMVAEQGNRVRMLLQQMDKEDNPPVYEISDDD